MDIERPHRTTSTSTSELFICFTSRLSKSSSMRLSSKSILSPARAAAVSDIKGSLSTSISRRLRHNGSVRRGAQSPAMFPSSKKNKGSSGFADNPEPSSPKVTCIGQVRVKTKKQGKKMKMRACRSKRLSSGGGAGGGGETSFRRIEHSHSHEGTNQGLQNQQNQQECGLNHRNQRWVHLPLTICEALRTFGSEFSCFSPCKSSCFSSGGFCGGGGDKGEEKETPSPTSCAVFRWLVSLQDGEGDGDGGGKRRRDIELVVGGEEEVENRVMMMERDCSRRRSIFDDMEFDDLFTNNNLKNNDNNGRSGEIIDNDVEYDCDEKGGKLSVCVPPKNALLLMRCRSDPLKMASLSRKLWEVPLPQPDDDVVDDDDDDGVDDNVEHENEEVKVVEREVVLDGKIEEIGEVETGEIKELKTGEIREDETEEIIEVKTEEIVEEIDQVLENFEDLRVFAGEEKNETEEKLIIENREMLEEEKCETLEETQLIEDEIDADECLIEGLLVEEKVEDDKNEQDLVAINLEELLQILAKAEEEERESVALLETDELSIVDEEKEIERERGESSEISASSYSLNSSEESTAESKEREDEEEQEQEKDQVEVVVEEQEQVQVEEDEEARKSMEGENNKKKTLPDCLFLMMCEPKVSMEVSKETWVCSTDFSRWLPERHQKKVANKAAVAAMPPHLVKPQRYEQAAQPPIQPGRSSISFPASGGSVANFIEQKRVKGGGGGGYEPFVLTRCKSAPLRSAAKIPAPEIACSLWGRENGRKLESHRPATFGVGF
ncbi:hypothetical protein SOVF_127280 [Spinacia oleracea]|uniref:Calmodulin-binding domain-containing protein n=1 Tax=Spinacia oleracea TaxID=3562 RepID=A0A9R0IRS9_SPIOL|nr:uncharacterized protein LOC110792561 [Spinacia oleracea]KNA12292.1 hypothetical protein SOVF_127280 [Spinacia oleracea]